MHQHDAFRNRQQPHSNLRPAVVWTRFGMVQHMVDARLDDGGDVAQGRVIQGILAHDFFKGGAMFIMRGQGHAGHPKGCGIAGSRFFLAPGDKHKFRLGIDKALYQPGGGHPVEVNKITGDPFHVRPLWG